MRWLELACNSRQGDSVPAYVEREFRHYLECAILATAPSRCDAPNAVTTFSSHTPARSRHVPVLQHSAQGRDRSSSCRARHAAASAAPVGALGAHHQGGGGAIDSRSSGRADIGTASDSSPGAAAVGEVRCRARRYRPNRSPVPVGGRWLLARGCLRIDPALNHRTSHKPNEH